MLTFSSVLGTVALVFYTFPLLGIIFAPMTVIYFLASMYYRRTYYDTVVFHSIRQSHVTGPQKSTKCHDGHGHFGEVTKSFLDSKKKF